MCWDPNTENSDVYRCDDSHGPPFQRLHRTSMLSDERNSVDNNLHQQLDLEYPT